MPAPDPWSDQFDGAIDSHVEPAPSLTALPPARRGVWALAALVAGILLCWACTHDPRHAHAPFFPALPPTLILGLAAGTLAAALITRRRLAAALLALAVVLLGWGWATLRTQQWDRDALAWALLTPSPNSTPATPSPPLPRAPSNVPVRVQGVLADWPLFDPGRPARPGLDTAGLGRPPAVRLTLWVRGFESAEGWRRASGTLHVLAPAGSPAARAAPGQLLDAIGTLRPIGPPLRPGDIDRRPIAAQDNLVGTLILPHPDLLTLASSLTTTPTWSDSLGQSWAAFRGVLRARAAAALDAASTPPTTNPNPDSPSSPTADQKHTREARAMLRALLLGADDQALEPVDAAFARLGIVHVLSISGFHLAVLAALLLVLVRFLSLLLDTAWRWLIGGESLLSSASRLTQPVPLLGPALAALRRLAHRGPGSIEPTLVAAAIALYLLVVPAEAPVLRAGLMVLVWLAAKSFGRRYDSLNLLAWTAFALLLWRPWDAFDPGFQLSFGLTAVLIWLAPAVAHRWLGPPVRGLLAGTVPVGADADTRRRASALALHQGLPSLLHRATTWTASLVATSVLAWLISVPIVMHHTGLLSPFAAITSILLVPLFVLLLILGYLAILLALISAAFGLGHALTRPIADLLAHLADWAWWSARLIDGFPGASVTTPPVGLVSPAPPPLAQLTSAAWAAAAVACLIAWVITRRPWARWHVIALTALVVISLTWSWTRPTTRPEQAPEPEQPALTAARIDVLSVGAGSVVLLRPPPTHTSASASADSVLWLSDAPSDWPRQEWSLIRSLRALGAWRVRRLVLPAAAIDPDRGPVGLVNALGVREVFIAPSALAAAHSRPASAPARLVAALQPLGVTIRPLAPGDDLPIGPFAHLHILSPASANPDTPHPLVSPDAFGGTLAAELRANDTAAARPGAGLLLLAGWRADDARAKLSERLTALRADQRPILTPATGNELAPSVNSTSRPRFARRADLAAELPAVGRFDALAAPPTPAHPSAPPPSADSPHPPHTSRLFLWKPGPTEPASPVRDLSEFGWIHAWLVKDGSLLVPAHPTFE